MKLQARNFAVQKPETIDITMFFKKFCIATRTIERTIQFALFFLQIIKVVDYVRIRNKY